MEQVENSILAYIFRREPGCRQDRIYFEVVDAYLDGIDLAILHYIAKGKGRDETAELLYRTRRTVEKRLQNMRAMFKCKNTPHLIANLAAIPMTVGEEILT